MQVIKTIDKLRPIVKAWKKEGLRVGLTRQSVSRQEPI